MKRLIDGVFFDTKKSKKIADASYRTGGFGDYDESLYLREETENAYSCYFLAGSGGPQSHYSITENGTTTGDSGITILGYTNDSDFDETKEKVLAWIGRHFVDNELEKVLKKSELAWWTTN